MDIGGTLLIVGLILALALISLLFAEDPSQEMSDNKAVSGGMRHKETPPRSVDEFSDEEGVAIKKKLFATKDLTFSIRHSPGIGLSIDFDGSGYKAASGVLKISQSGVEDYQIWLLIYPQGPSYNLAGVNYEKYLLEQGANELSVDCWYSGIKGPMRLAIEPDCTEEGWVFSFGVADYRPIGVYRSYLSSTSIVRAMLRSDYFVITVSNAGRTSEEEWSRTRFRGESTEIVSIKFSRTDILRDRFAKAFGIEKLEEILEQVGMVPKT